MAKYSTGGGESAGDSCELCGAADVETSRVNVAGAKLSVCSDCAQHDDTSGGGDGGSTHEESRSKRAAQNTAKVYDAASGDSAHWESGADYDEDQLPYLVSDYADRLTEARQEAGFQLEELADELGVDEADLLALEQGRATQAGVGGSVVESVESFLDLELVEQR